MMNWTIDPLGEYMIGQYGPNINSENIAAFDLDDTLIQKKTRDLYNSDTLPILTKYSNTHRLVIVTNQNGIERGYETKEQFKSFVEELLKKIDLPITIYVAITRSIFRKPNTGFFDKFIPYNKGYSFYCGDAGGLPARRIQNIKIKKDFSDGDLKYALNLGVRFVHRDELYYGVNTLQRVEYVTRPKGIMPLIEPFDQEMLLMVGYPASGKSYWACKMAKMNPNYKIVSLDIEKTKVRITKKIIDNLELGFSIIVDNTNFTIENRKSYIDLAKKYNVDVRCIVIDCPMELAWHNNLYRAYYGNMFRNIVPKTVYYSLRKKHVKPSNSEGPSDVISIKFSYEGNDPFYDKYYEKM